MSLTAAVASPKLCSLCQTLDLDDIFSSQPGSSGGRGIADLYVSERMRGSKCPLCRLIFSAHVKVAWSDVYYPKPKAEDRHHLRAFHAFDIGRRGRRRPFLPDVRIFLGVVPGTADEGYVRSEHLDDCRTTGLICRVPRGTGSEPRNLAHTVNSAVANIDQVRGWLQHCTENHSQTCKEREPRGTFGLKVIDCLTRKIVPLRNQDEYFALSYVWGLAGEKAEIAQGSEPPSSLPAASRLSKVIKDAIDVVLSLGGRFLWVDKYCINQRHGAEKDEQIRNMHLIYHSALATIVNASTGGPEIGLPGAGGTPRTPQPSAVVSGYIYISTMREITPLLQEARWSRRGWTYQEGVFSRRSIFFTDEQVHFVCRGMQCKESLDMEKIGQMVPMDHEISLTTALLNPAVLVNDIRKTEQVYPAQKLWNLYVHLFNYSCRQLTYGSDAVNAFSGILTGLGYPHLWGVPVIVSDDTGNSANFRSQMYDLGLVRGLWLEEMLGLYLDSPWQDDIAFLRRNTGFPTWSWAGWTGRLRRPVADQPNEVNVVWASDNTPQFHIELLDGSNMSISDYCERVQSRVQIACSISHTLIVEGSVTKLKFQSHKQGSAGRGGPIAFWRPCHQDSLSTHDNPNEEDKFPLLRLYEDYSASPSMRERLFDMKWDALVLTDLLWQRREPGLWLLVFDGVESACRVVGKLLILDAFLENGTSGDPALTFSKKVLRLS